jgi:iron complex outermembrane receptor protein
LFGEVTWHPLSAWQITGGARFFKQDFSTAAYSALPYCGSFCGTGDLGVTYVPPNGYSVNDHIFKFNTSYKLSGAANAYFNYSEGFRRGGANGIPLAGPFAVNPALQIYTPDKTKNFEVGLKGSAPGLNYTIDYFYIHWDNFQLDSQSYAGGYALAANGQLARSQGVEMTLDGAIGTHFNYQLGYTYTRAQVARDFAIQDYLDDGSGGTAAIVSGKAGDTLPNAPKNSATWAVNYTHGLAPALDAWHLRWHLGGSYRSAALSQLVNTVPGARPPFVIQGFMLWDGAVELSNGKLYANLYGQNLFNALAVTGGVDAAEAAPGPEGTRAAHYYVGRPRTVGLRVGYRF